MRHAPPGRGQTERSVGWFKERCAENFDGESKQKLAVFGAFSLYFISIFQLLLNFTGQGEE